MITKTLWHIDATYRITGDTEDDGRDRSFFIAANDDIAEVSTLIITAMQEHVDEHHGAEMLADLTVHVIERVDDIQLEGEE